jgi:hypothetical protein
MDKHKNPFRLTGGSKQVCVTLETFLPGAIPRPGDTLRVPCTIGERFGEWSNDAGQRPKSGEEELPRNPSSQDQVPRMLLRGCGGVPRCTSTAWMKYPEYSCTCSCTVPNMDGLCCVRDNGRRISPLGQPADKNCGIEKTWAQVQRWGIC